MPTLQVSNETMKLLRVLRAWTELSESWESSSGKSKKYSLDAALLKALQGMNLPLELPKDIVERIKRGERIILTEVGTGQRRAPSGVAGKRQS